MSTERREGVLRNNMPNYLEEEVCAKCGGVCCKRYAGIAYPSDFAEPLEESLRVALSSGDWSIDWWEGECEGCAGVIDPMFIRPRHKGGEVIDPSWGGECVLANVPVYETGADAYLQTLSADALRGI